mgnify:FL=1
MMHGLRPLVSAAARRFVHRAVDVEDIEQETWIVFVRHAERIEYPDRLACWLWSTSSNLARRAARRDARWTTMDDITSWADAAVAAAVTDDNLIAAERSAALRVAVQSLPPHDRQFVELLTDPQDFSYAAVGSMLKRPVGSLGPTRQRLVCKLRNHPAIERVAAEC